MFNLVLDDRKVTSPPVRAVPSGTKGKIRPSVVHPHPVCDQWVSPRWRSTCGIRPSRIREVQGVWLDPKTSTALKCLRRWTTVNLHLSIFVERALSAAFGIKAEKSAFDAFYVDQLAFICLEIFPLPVPVPRFELLS